MLMKTQTTTRLTSTTTTGSHGTSSTTSSSSSSYPSPEYIRRQYQMRQKIVKNDVLKEELYMHELEAKLASLRTPAKTPLSRTDTSQAAQTLLSEQAAGHAQSTALLLRNQSASSNQMAMAMAPLARHPVLDRTDQALPALLPMHVPLKSLSILQVGRLLQHHNLTSYIEPFARNYVDGVILAETTLSHDDLCELGVHIRLHRVRLFKVIQEFKRHGVPPSMLYRHQREEELPASHADDSDYEDEENSYKYLIGVRSTDTLDEAFAGRESAASFSTVMEGEGKEEGIIRQEAATRTNRVAGCKT